MSLRRPRDASDRLAEGETPATSIPKRHRTKADAHEHAVPQVAALERELRIERERGPLDAQELAAAKLDAVRAQLGRDRPRARAIGDAHLFTFGEEREACPPR